MTLKTALKFPVFALKFPVFALKFPVLLSLLFSFAAVSAPAQQLNQPSLAITPTNRTLALSAEQTVTAAPDLAILHLGFTTQPASAKDAYAAAAQASNAIVAALKQAGLTDADIHSQSQQMQLAYNKPHKFIVEQQWTVDAPPARAAELLDIAISAGATDSGEIEWTMRDLKQLDDQALRAAAARLRQQAATLADSMGVHLGPLLYTTNNVSRPIQVMAMSAYDRTAPQNSMNAAAPLAIEPHTVSSTATVYAIFTIE